MGKGEGRAPLYSRGVSYQNGSSIFLTLKYRNNEPQNAVLATESQRMSFYAEAMIIFVSKMEL